MKKVIVRESTRAKTESALKTKGIDITVLWDTAYCNNGDVNTRIKTVCNTCGDIEDHSLGALTCGKYRCNPCLINKYVAGCEKLNLNFIEKLYEKDQLKLSVKCKVCGECCNASAGHILDGSFRCDGCLLDKYITACDKLNLKFINKKYSNNVTRLNTECNVCGHVDYFASGDIIKGKFRCDGCLLIKYKTALEKKNCKLISVEKRYNKRTLLHYVNCDGDSFSASAYNVVGGKFETSLNGYWSQPHSVYLIKLKVDCNTNIYKIGTANDPHKRAKDLKLNKDHKVFTLASFETRYEADKLESELHNEFADNRLCSHSVSEHTDGRVSRRRSDGKFHRIKDGITEWFSSEVFDILSQRYNLE